MLLSSTVIWPRLTPAVPNQRRNLQPTQAQQQTRRQRVLHRPSRRRLATRTSQRHTVLPPARHQHDLRRPRRPYAIARKRITAPARWRHLCPPRAIHQHPPRRFTQNPSSRYRPFASLQPQQSPQESSHCLTDRPLPQYLRLLHLAVRHPQLSMY